MIDSEEQLQRLASEYVLGTLALAERAEVEQRLPRDAALPTGAVASAASSSRFSASQIILAPTAPSRPKAIQWSTASTKPAAATPRAKPIRGVIASTTPNTRPDRRA